MAVDRPADTFRDEPRAESRDERSMLFLEYVVSIVALAAAALLTAAR